MLPGCCICWVAGGSGAWAGTGAGAVAFAALLAAPAPGLALVRVLLPLLAAPVPGLAVAQGFATPGLVVVVAVAEGLVMLTDRFATPSFALLSPTAPVDAPVAARRHLRLANDRNHDLCQ